MPAKPSAAGEMSPGTDVVAAEVGQPLQVANDASLSDAVPSKLSLEQTDAVIAHWLGVLIGTNDTLGEAREMDVLVDTIHQLAPTVNWVHVMEDEGFSIPDEAIVNLMKSINTRVRKESLPLDSVYPSLWKNTEGQKCLMTFVDICKGLQILCAVLDSTPFPFIIKLAVAASRKDHIPIEKWLSAKSDVYKGLFLEECVTFLEGIMSSTPVEQPQTEVMNIYWGSFPLFVKVCQSPSGELLPTKLSDEHSTVRFGTVRDKLEKQVREVTSKYLLQGSSLDIIKDHIGMLLKDQQLSKDIIFKEKEEVSKLKAQRLKYPSAHWQHECLQVEYGPVILKLKTLAKSNDESLKYLRERLLKYFNDDDLLRQVDGILERNKAASKIAGSLISEYHDYCSRANIEVSWIDGAEHKFDEVYRFLSGDAAVLEEVESHIGDLNRTVILLSKERTQNFHLDCQDLNTLAKLYEDIEILSKELLCFTESAKEQCLRSKNLRDLFKEKAMNATRFQRTEQHLKDEKESSKMCQELLDLRREVEQARNSLKEKMVGLPEVGDADKDKKYERILVEKGLSWRTRLLHDRNIMGEIREQGLDMCAFVSTVVMRESLGKREDARYSIRYGGQWYRPMEHFIKLSEYNLQDIYRAFCAKNKRKGREKLDVCMERMIETGVVSESEYDDAANGSVARGSIRYHISKFEQMDEGNYEVAFGKLDEARVLVGTFGITKGYYSVGAEDIYDAPKGAILETNAAGNKLTHAVVIVGYGVSPEGLPYYAYQNSYGPGWGKDGFGMVSCRSIRQLYSAEV